MAETEENYCRIAKYSSALINVLKELSTNFDFENVNILEIIVYSGNL